MDQVRSTGSHGLATAWLALLASPRKKYHPNHHTAADKNGRSSLSMDHFHFHSPEAPDMTETLAQKKCTPCRGGVPPLTHEEAERFQSQTPNWDLLDDSHRIERTFRFRNFLEALGFVRNVGDLAETEGHHPDISFGWGYASISLRTKKIKGLHENDFIMASKIDRIFDRSHDPLDRQQSRGIER